MSYLIFRERTGDIKRKTKTYNIYNKNHILIGNIYFNPSWRKYIFESEYGIILDSQCLQEIINFLNKIQQEWKESIKKDRT